MKIFSRFVESGRIVSCNPFDPQQKMCLRVGCLMNFRTTNEGFLINRLWCKIYNKSVTNFWISFNERIGNSNFKILGIGRCQVGEFSRKETQFGNCVFEFQLLLFFVTACQMTITAFEKSNHLIYWA